MEQLKQEEYLKFIEDWKLEHKEEIKNIHYRKVFLECLPTYNHNGGGIDWENSINFKIYFIYNGNQVWAEIMKYIKKEHALILKYDNQENKIYTSNLLKFKSGKFVDIQTSEFKYEIGTNFQDKKRDITIIDRKKMKDKKTGQWKKYYKYTCCRCGFDGESHYSVRDKVYKQELWSLESSLLNGQGCACCSNKIVVESINSIYHTNKWMIPIINDDEFCKTHTHGCCDKVYPTCIDCGRVKTKLMKINEIYKQKSIGCSCGDGKSYPEKLMISILEQLNINFEMEVVFEWCKYIFKNKIKSGRYDFYFKVNTKKYIIETDGSWHIKDNTKSGQTKEESKVIDDEKDRLALENGYKVIRIDCNYAENNRLKYIKNKIISNKKINELFDLSIIDWNKAEKFALSNLVKIACDYKRESPDMTSTDISKIMKYSVVSIIRWLKVGNELSWCYYNAKEERSNNMKKVGRLTCKPVEMFKDDTSLGIFESATELSRQSEQLFGIKLNNSNISLVCAGKKLKYKGYTFIYVS